jgi:hypothetical protein
MHCPQCGQQQVSDEMRFCSRCGFPLGVVAELISKGGTLPDREAESSPPKLGARQRGKRLGLLLMLTGFVLAIIGGIIHDSMNPLERSALVTTLLLFIPAIICGVAGFVRFLYALLLETNAPGQASVSQVEQIRSSELSAGGNYPELPSSQGMPVSDLGARRGNTTEIVNVPSVTENTTKLLDKQS